MYKIKTNKATYAVKVLNPLIMKKESVMKNYIFSKKVVYIASRNGIPVIPALGEEKFIHILDGKHFIIFNWVDAKSITSSKFTKEHCKKIGSVNSWKIRRQNCKRV